MQFSSFLNNIEHISTPNPAIVGRGVQHNLSNFLVLCDRVVNLRVTIRLHVADQGVHNLFFHDLRKNYVRSRTMLQADDGANHEEELDK